MQKFNANDRVENNVQLCEWSGSMRCFTQGEPVLQQARVPMTTVQVIYKQALWKVEKSWSQNTFVHKEKAELKIMCNIKTGHMQDSASNWAPIEEQWDHTDYYDAPKGCLCLGVNYNDET